MSNKDFYTHVDFHNQSLINPRLNPMNTAEIEAGLSDAQLDAIFLDC